MCFYTFYNIPLNSFVHEAAQKYDELSQLVRVLGRTIQNQEKLTEEYSRKAHVDLGSQHLLRAD